MDPDLRLPPAQIANRCLIFREGSLPNSASVPRGHSVDFSARPRSEWDLALNRFIHCSVLDGYVDPVAAHKLFGLHIVALILPPSLAQWLVRWNRLQVERAIACILIDASGIEGPSDAPLEWAEQDHLMVPPHSQSPSNIFPQDIDIGRPVDQEIENAKSSGEIRRLSIDDDAMSYASDDVPLCPASLQQNEVPTRQFVPETPPLSVLIHGIPPEHRTHPCPALPYVTEASKQLDDLLQLLAGDTLWTIPVQFVAVHPRRVLAPNCPPHMSLDAQSADVLSPRSFVSCLNTDLELDAHLSFNIPLSLREKSGLFTQGAVLTSEYVYCLFEKWFEYISHVAKIGVHPRRALYNFGRLVASGKESELWDRVKTVMDIAGLSLESATCSLSLCANSEHSQCASYRSGLCLHSKYQCDGRSVGAIRKGGTHAIVSGSRKRSRRLLRTLPVDLLKDVLIPKIVAALSE